MRTTVEPVIVLAECQREAVERLVTHCKNLDGTKITVLEAPACTTLPYPKCNDASFHFAAAHFKGRPFFWMEPDSIPLKAGWLQALSDEYYRAGKEFMLSSDSHPPHDLVGGIGIYGPHTHWIIPKEFSENAWDFWMYHHTRPITHWTPLIQHSYGRYFGGKANPHRFPRDKSILREDALLFHRDKFQDLLVPEEAAAKDDSRSGVVMRHGGDIGDVIAALPILRARGGGKIILFHDPNAPKGMRGRESLEGTRFEVLKPLLEAQPYVTNVEWGVGVDTNNFRLTPRPKTESLLERQARHVGVWPVDLSPWLDVPEFEPHNRVVCARSPRYHNPYSFPWAEVAETYGNRLLFVGLPGEHAEFERLLGCKIEHAKTENLLDVAKLMAGAPQVVCNQSAPAWIALGLGVKMILEGNPDVPNTELPGRDNFYSYTPEQHDILRRALAKVRAQRR
jgi:hypothetical protein